MVWVFRDWWLVPGYQLVSWWPLCLTSLGLGFLSCKQQVKPSGPEVSSRPGGWACTHPKNHFLFPSHAPLNGFCHPVGIEKRPALWTLPACRIIWKFCAAAAAAHLSACPSLPPTHTSWHCILFLEISTETHFLSPPWAVTLYQSIHRVSVFLNLEYLGLH